MAAYRQPGSDHDLYEYAPLPTRAALPGMQGKRILVYLALQLEHWELLPPEGSVRDPRFKGEFGTFSPEFRTWTSRDYGNRIGAYRVIELLDQMGLRPTVALGAALAQTHPSLVALVRQRGWEVVAHGFSANRMISSRMDQDEERTFIRTCRDQITHALQRDVHGWLGQDFGATPRTADLLRAAGFSYTLDWSNDEQPYWLRAGGHPRGLIAVPGPSELDDVQTIGLRKLPPTGFVQLVRDALEGWREAPITRVLPIGIHPWLLGTPHRFRYLRETLEALRAHPEVFFTTAGDIAGHYRNLTLETGHVVP